jgi:class 3 adenylate cyclase/predicted ATPase
MQCARCSVEVRQGVRFCEDCGASLSASCPQCAAELTPGKKFCGSCGQPAGGGAADRFPTPETYTPGHLADRILSSRRALEGERKHITVLFADLKASMELLAERDPEEARRLLDPVLERMMDAVHRYEGTVNQVMGDGIMALFGAPLGLEDHATRACHAALAMQAAIRAYGEEVRRAYGLTLRIRVGLNSGEVVVRAIGSDLRMDYTAVGQTTHLAARMEQLADPGTIWLTADTLRLAEGSIEARSLGPVPVKGLEGPVDVYELMGARPRRARLHVVAARGRRRLVGREIELEQARQALIRGAQGHGQLLVVSGEPGVGKSRLSWEIAQWGRTGGWLVVQAGSVSYGRATPYLPVVDLLRDYFHLDGGEDAGAVRERVTAKVLSLDRGLGEALPPLLALLDAAPADSGWRDRDPGQRRRLTQEAVQRLLLRESQSQPVLLVVEDLHWIDAESQAVLDGLVDRLPTARLVLLATHRPEHHDGWGGKTYATQLHLHPLPAERAEELLRALLGEDESLRPLTRRLIARTEGNPFFLEECVRTLVETGALVGEPGAFQLARAVETVEVPATVQAILAARIDRLPAGEKELLQTAAVVGRDVPLAVLEAVVPRPGEELRRELTSLQAAEFLYETGLLPGTEYTFKHALTQEVAYRSLLRTARERSHGRIAAVLEERFPDQAEVRPDLLAHHYAEAGLGARAVPYWHRAGQRASQRSAHREAIAYARHGLDLVATIPAATERISQELALQAALAVSLMTTAGFAAPEVGQAYARLRELCLQAGETTQSADVFAGLWGYHAMRAEFPAALELGEELLRAGQRTQDPDLLIRARHALEVTRLRMGDFATALDHAKQGIALYDPGRHGAYALRHGFDPGANLRAGAAWALWVLGYPDQASAWVRDMVALARQHGHRTTLAQLLYYAARIHQYLREPLRVAEYAQACLEVATQHGFAFWRADGKKVLGWALATQGRHAEGLAHIREGLEAYRATGAVTGLPYDLALLAEASDAAGRGAEGLAALAEAQAIVKRTGEGNHEAELYRLEGELRLRYEAQPGDAEACFRQALAIARRQSARSWELRAATSLGRLLAATDRRDEARTTLDAVYRGFTEGFGTADLKAAAALLDTLQ